MKTKGISSSAYDVIDSCLIAEINRLSEQVRKEPEVGKAIQAAELLGKLKAARSEFIAVHVA
jgi:hypothetical protein